MNFKLKVSGLPIRGFFCLAFTLALMVPAYPFEGRIKAELTRGGVKETFTYTYGAHTLRIERDETDRPHPVNLIALDTGTVTLLFPHNRSFMRLVAPGKNGPPAAGLPPGMPTGIGPRPVIKPPGAPRLPHDSGPRSLPGAPGGEKPELPQMPALPADPGVGVPGIMPVMPPMPGMPPLPGMPAMPMTAGEPLELKATGEESELLGHKCEGFELKQRGEVMEIRATGTLPAFQPYLQKRWSRFQSSLMEDCWGDLMRTRKLFPLLVILKSENGAERLRFEIKSITPEKIDDRDGSLFQLPAGYHELEAPTP